MARSFARIRWIRPSDGDPDIVSFETPSVAAWDQPQEPVLRTGGAVPGIILPKLMDRLINGELTRRVHALLEPVAIYARVLGAGRGGLVYMSLGQVQWVSLS